MNKVIFSILTVSLILLSFNISNAQVELFVAGSDSCDNPAPATDSTLYRVNPQNADAVAIGPIGFQGVTGLAQLGDGRIVASAHSDDDDGGDNRTAILIKLNPFTGQGILIGEIGDNNTPGECGRAPDLTYDPATDTLYAIGRRCMGFANNEPVFMSINQATGQGTIISATGVFGGAGNGLARRADGTFFWAVNVEGPNPTTLFTINPATGLATFVTTLSEPTPALGAFAFQPVTQELFATHITDVPNSILQTLNTTSGLLTTIGDLPNCSDALVFVQSVPRPIPTLSEWGLIAMAGILGLVGFIAIRKRYTTA